MQFVCAWCRRKLGFSPLHPDAPDNYGICEKCLGERMAALVARRPLPLASQPGSGGSGGG